MANPVERKDILNQLLRTHKENPEALSLDEIVAITTTNVIADSDTTAISISSVLYYLGKHPAARQKLEQEIETAVAEGRASNPITYAEAIKLPYFWRQRLGAHYKKDVFGDDAHVFRPERWIEGDEGNIKDMKRNMFAFGFGPRSCIGKNISILEMWKVVFELYRNFDITLSKDEDWTVKGHWFTPQSNVGMTFREKTRG